MQDQRPLPGQSAPNEPFAALLIYRLAYAVRTLAARK